MLVQVEVFFVIAPWDAVGRVAAGRVDLESAGEKAAVDQIDYGPFGDRQTFCYIAGRDTVNIIHRKCKKHCKLIFAGVKGFGSFLFIFIFFFIFFFISWYLKIFFKKEEPGWRSRLLGGKG